MKGDYNNREDEISVQSLFSNVRRDKDALFRELSRTDERGRSFECPKYKVTFRK